MNRPRASQDHSAHRPTRRSRLGAIGIVAVTLALSIWSVLAAPGRLKLDTNPEHLLDENLPIRKAQADYRKAFPENNPALIVVVDAPTPERAEQAAEQLSAALRAQTTYFTSVDRPYAGPFFERNGLLYQSEDELHTLTDRLAEAQPLMAKLNADPTVRGLSDVLAQAIDHAGDFNAGALVRLFERFQETLEAQRAGRDDQVSWREVMSGDDDAAQRLQVIFVSPRLDFQKVWSAGEPIELIRAAGRSPDIARGGARVRVTGRAALAHEELQSVLGGMGYIAPITTVLVGAVLFLAMRSFRLVAASIIALVVGLALTLSVATFGVGRLNLISIAFGVLFLGLASDYVIHLSLRLQEARTRGLSLEEAIRTARRSTTGALWMCSITTAVGFYAFWPTEFDGVSELGLIAGTGMFITLAVSLIVLPALWRIMPPSIRSIERYRNAHRSRAGSIRLIEHLILPVAVILALAGLASAPRLRFDPDPLSLRDPQSESVRTVHALEDADQSARETIVVVAPNEPAAQALREQLESLETVDETITIENFVPERQSEKLQIIDEMSLIVGPSFESFGAEPPSKPDSGDRVRLDDFARLAEVLGEAASSPETDPDLAHRSAALREAISDALAAFSRAAPDRAEQYAADLEARWLGTFAESIERLRDSLGAGVVTREDLPPDLVSRWVSPDGQLRMDVRPNDVTASGAGRREFVREALSVAPDAIGPPVEKIESGDAVVRSFAEAISISLGAITLVVWVYFRSALRAIAVLLPLVLAALLLSFVMTVWNISFNFANVIALPLLFGIGVDSGIHIIHQADLHRDRPDHTVDPTTARAVFFSAVTTIASFGNLSISPHPGTASMGVVLTIGMGLILFTTLLVLPAAMTRWMARFF